MVICPVPSTFAVQDNGQKHDLNRAIHEKMDTLGTASFSIDNSALEIRQEKMLEQINDTISFIEFSMTGSHEPNDANITAEMLADVTTQLKEAKTLVENAEDKKDLKEATEMVHSAMETLGMGPATMDKPEALPEHETFQTQQERMLEQINDTISFIEFSMIGSDEPNDANITAEMLADVTTQLKEAKTLVENAEDEKDLKEATEMVHSAMEEIEIGPNKKSGMEPRPMGKPGMSSRKDLCHP